ncbi:MAG TPA: VOC family protein [Bacteroidota bacterium]|nr:VOC family protein [Bacteroidota bacterium]
MITQLRLVTILVADQDEALKWFTERLGLVKIQDAVINQGMRWLVVGPQGDSGTGIVLQKPEPSVHGLERARELSELIGKGTTWVFRSDDVDRTYEELKGRGVKFTSPPTPQSWGKQAIFEDLYGNRYALL